MKTKISRIGKRSLSLVITIMMLVSMMVVGMVTTDAAISYWFVSGSFNNWITSPGSYQLVNNKITVDMNSYLNQQITFKMVAYEGGNIWCGKDNTTLTSGSEIELAWNAGGDLKYTPTKRYVTFSLSVRNEKNYLTVTESSSDPNAKNWYLSGYIGHDGYNHSDTGVASPDFQMKQSSSNSNEYTLTYKVCGDQYFTVNDGTNVYHPTSNNASSGTAAGSPDYTATGDCWKWYAAAAGGSEITVKWNASTKVLSWTVKAERTFTLYDGNDKSLGTFTKDSDGVYTLDVKLTAGTTTQLYIKDSEDIYYRRDSETPISESGGYKTLYRYGTNDTTHFCSVAAPTTGTYTFTWEYTGDGAEDTEGVLTVDFPAGSTTYSVTTSTTANGTIKTNVTSAAAGATVTVTATPNSGYECTKVTVSPSTTVTDKGNGTYTFTMPSSNVTVSATFTKIIENGDYKITKTASPYGTMTVVTSSGVKEGTANAGDTITVTVNPLKGYACTGLTVITANGAVETTANEDGTYTFTMPSADVTITATYETTIITYNLAETVSNAAVTFATSSSSSATVAQPGDKVTVTITPNNGYLCSAFKVLDSNDVEIAVEKLSSTKYTFVMPESDITVTATVAEYTPEANHTFTVYFKAPSAFAYQPKVSLDGAAQVSMTKGQELGKIYSGALTIYWYSCEFTVDTSTAHTLTFKTARTNLNASITDYFVEDTYYLAVDNLMTGTQVVDLSEYSGDLEYIRNYYRSATHMVYPYIGASDDTDNTLGFTNIDGVRYKMGECIRDGRVSIMSATLIQKVASETETVDNVQMALLDVNLDGTVDVRDATLTQKYLVNA